MIGRPISFQGLGVTRTGRRGILERAAKRAGFREVCCYSIRTDARRAPDYEAMLREEKRVLVVDIGGGTADCSMLLMGPQWRQRAVVKQPVGGTAVCRVGGNDWTTAWPLKSDAFAGHGRRNRKGIALPVLPWWNAVAV